MSPTNLNNSLSTQLPQPHQNSCSFHTYQCSDTKFVTNVNRFIRVENQIKTLMKLLVYICFFLKSEICMQHALSSLKINFFGRTSCDINDRDQARAERGYLLTKSLSQTSSNMYRVSHIEVPFELALTDTNMQVFSEVQQKPVE